MSLYAPIGVFDPFLFTEAQLLQIKDRCFQLMMEGKTIMAYTGEGTEASREFVMPIDHMLIEVTWSLKSKLPQKYGYLSDNCQVYFM